MDFSQRPRLKRIDHDGLDLSQSEWRPPRTGLVQDPGNPELIGSVQSFQMISGKPGIAPAMALLSDGSLVVTDHVFADETFHYDIYIRRLGSDGAPAAAAVRVNAGGNDVYVYNAEPQALGLPDGGIIVIWTADWLHNGVATNYPEIRAQRLDAAGNPVGNNFFVNTGSAYAQSDGDIALLTSGGYVVTWTSAHPAQDKNIHAQMFASNGARLGGEILINQVTSSIQEGASVVGLTDGGFVVVWDSYGSGSTDVFARRFDSSGVAAGDQFAVHAPSAGEQTDPHVALLDNGHVVFSWTSGLDIYARIFDMSGSPVTGEIQVTLTPDTHRLSSVSPRDGGGFVVSWSTAVPGEGQDAHAQAFDVDGNRVGSTFSPAPSQSGSQNAVNAVRLTDGTTAFAWGDSGSGLHRIMVAQYDTRIDESVSGGGGPDLLEGFDGSDTIAGGEGDDTISGGSGDDVLVGGPGGDLQDGGTGLDWADFSTGPRIRADLLQPGTNTGQAAGDTYSGIENMRGSDFADILRGDNGANVLEGGPKNDALRGRSGTDTLIGGIGFDRLEGQGGADHFVLQTTAPNADIIEDFVAGADKLSLDGGLFGLTPGALDPDAFVAANSAQDAEDRLIYRAATGKLFYDPDGVGGAAQILIATFENLPTLAATDFIVT